MRDAAAIIGCRAPRHLLLCVGKRHGELRFLKCRVGHVVQLMDRLLRQRAHICVHIRQRVGNRRNRSAAVMLVINADQVFLLNGERNIAHAHTSKSLSFAFAAAFLGAAVFFDCPSLSCARTEGRYLRSGRSRCSSLLIKAKMPCLSLTEERYSVLYGSSANSRSCSLGTVKKCSQL